ncbi:MAG: ATP-binding protein [Desulfobacteraceae bacterium]|nr:MAG: ATP-binding protein [Desulfobacteraceae bacterium]
MTISAKELTPEDLYHPFRGDQLSFETTSDLDGLNQFIGQPRAVRALHFGVGIEKKGYNIFAAGYPGTGKYSLIRHLLDERSSKEPVPPDVCYVNNFEISHQPRVLHLPPGQGRLFSESMEKLIENVRNAVKSSFENEEYQNRRQTIAQEFQELQQQALEKVQQQAKERSLTVLRTPAGIVFAPVRNEEVIPPEEFSKLPEETRRKVEGEIEELQAQTRKIFQRMPGWEREMREKIGRLDKEITGFVVSPFIEDFRRKYEGMSEVIDYLNTVEKDIIDHVQALLPEDSEQKSALQQIFQSGQKPPSGEKPENPFLRRYKVNVIVNNGDIRGAPVVYEDNPNYQNLIGRVEHLPHMGMLLTDFDMIRAGALHRANGGYLILDIVKILSQPFAWEALKRCLKSSEIKIESLGALYGMISTVSLDPEPVALNVKVVLMGPPNVNYLLKNYDPEFSDLFKVTADFDTVMNRTPDNQDDYCRLLADLVRKDSLRPFDRSAVARIVEHSARLVGDGERLTIRMQTIKDLLRESDYWAGQNGNGAVNAADVQKAIDEWIFRSDRIRQRMQEEIHRGTVFIDTEGSRVGQVNGLSVIQLGEFAFGRPSRISARIRMGKGEVVDIEREVEMGGPIHSKGVLILSSFLGARYAMDQPLSLSASLVFEQSYSGVEGDSASSAELYALLSAIAEVPIKQSIAVTGSVNQHGQIQPIGGVNEKIEGFFDTCKANGLSGVQGVIIPASNRKHLMLRKDVIDSVSEGRFHIFAVTHVDEGISILTGLPAGEVDKDGSYPPETINGRVRARLAVLAEKRMDFIQKNENGKRESI